jgi:hypothetical protein
MICENTFKLLYEIAISDPKHFRTIIQALSDEQIEQISQVLYNNKEDIRGILSQRPSFHHSFIHIVVCLYLQKGLNHILRDGQSDESD